MFHRQLHSVWLASDHWLAYVGIFVQCWRKLGRRSKRERDIYVSEAPMEPMCTFIHYWVPKPVTIIEERRHFQKIRAEGHRPSK